MDPLTGNVCRLSRVEAYAVTSTAERYMALFKAVLCGWGEIVGQGYTSRFGYTCVIQLQHAKINHSFGEGLYENSHHRGCRISG